MNKKAAASLTIILIFCTCIIGTVMAQSTAEIATGLKEGDTFKYDVTFTWTTSNVADVVPLDYVAYNQSEFQINIVMAMSSTVEYETIWRLRNGTVSTTPSEPAEVSTNPTNQLYFYAANLTTNEQLFPRATDKPWTVNDTTTRAYPNDGNRLTNHVDVLRTDLPDTLSSRMSIYFDKATGIMVEYTIAEIYNATPSQTLVRHMVMKETNAWTIPEFPTTLVLPLIMAAVIATAVLYKRKTSKTPTPT